MATSCIEQIIFTYDFTVSVFYMIVVLQKGEVDFVKTKGSLTFDHP